MKREVTMPRLGHLQEVGTVVEWRKRPGQGVRKGEVLMLIETEKTTVEVEATFDGTFIQGLIQTGVEVPVGTPIAICEETEGEL